MIKKYLLFIALISSCQVFSQEVYINAGKNYTKYNYKNALLQSSTNLQSGTGNSYEVGIAKPFRNEHVLYGLGVSLNDYNAIGGTSASSYRWDTQYLGAKANIYYSFFPNSKNINLLVNFGVDGSTIIYGKQEIDGTYYDLIHQKEFSGIWIGSSAGVQVKYRIESFGYLSLDYIFIQNLNVSNKTKEKVSFSTQQIALGFHFPIN
jgi:hypothetical protein